MLAQKAGPLMKLGDVAAKEALKKAEDAHGLPAVDPIRRGSSRRSEHSPHGSLDTRGRGVPRVSE